MSRRSFVTERDRRFYRYCRLTGTRPTNLARADWRDKGEPDPPEPRKLRIRRDDDRLQPDLVEDLR